MRIHPGLAMTLALACATAPVVAQQGVRAQSPRRDAGQHALRAIDDEQASRHIAGPSNIAPSRVAPHHGGQGRVVQYRHHKPHVTAHHDRGIFIGGSGIHIGGRFGDVHAGIHLGGIAHGGIIHHRPRHHFGHTTFGLHGRPYSGYSYGRSDTRQPVVQGPMVIIIDRTGVSTNEVDPAAPIVLDELPRIDPRAEGVAALYHGRAGLAVDHLTAHVLANEGDRRAERLLGVALVLNGQSELGIAVIARAYNGDPSLVFEPLGRDTIDSLSDWRRVQRDVQRYAGVHRTASSWLASIAVTQTELSKPRHAERLEYAKRAGLDVDVADALQRWLEGEGPSENPAAEPSAEAAGSPSAEEADSDTIATASEP